MLLDVFVKTDQIDFQCSDPETFNTMKKTYRRQSNMLINWES